MSLQLQPETSRTFLRTFNLKYRSLEKMKKNGDARVARDSKNTELTQFVKIVHGPVKAPQLKNSRLCFRSKHKVTLKDDGTILFCGHGDFLFLYWDGAGRWVISPELGAMVPYGYNEDETHGFLWCRDQAPVPNQITKMHKWHIYKKTSWEPVENVYIVASNKVTKPGKARRRSLRHEKEKHDSKMKRSLCSNLCGNPCGEGTKDDEVEEGCLRTFFTEIKHSFEAELGFQREPESKHCIVGLTCNHLMVAWKDDLIEKLAPFRKHLLKEFGSYDKVWYELTKMKVFKKVKGIFELKRMLNDSYNALKKENENEGQKQALLNQENYEDGYYTLQIVPAVTKERSVNSALADVGDLLKPGMIVCVTEIKTDSSEGRVRGKLFLVASETKDPQTDKKTFKGGGPGYISLLDTRSRFKFATKVADVSQKDMEEKNAELVKNTETEMHSKQIKLKQAQYRILERSEATASAATSRAQTKDVEFQMSNLLSEGIGSACMHMDNIPYMIKFLEGEMDESAKRGEEFHKLVVKIMNAIDTSSTQEIKKSKLNEPAKEGTSEVFLIDAVHNFEKNMTVILGSFTEETYVIKSIEDKSVILQSSLKRNHEKGTVFESVASVAEEAGSDEQISAGEIEALFQAYPVLVTNLPLNKEFDTWITDHLAGSLVDLNKNGRPMEINDLGTKQIGYALMLFDEPAKAQMVVDELTRNMDRHQNNREDKDYPVDYFEDRVPMIRTNQDDGEDNAVFTFCKEFLELVPATDAVDGVCKKFKIQTGPGMDLLKMWLKNLNLPNPKLGASELRKKIFPFYISLEKKSEKCPETSSPDEVLSRFNTWVLKHPWYNDKERFWGEISTGMEVNRTEFQLYLETTLAKYEPGSESTSDEVGHSKMGKVEPEDQDTDDKKLNCISVVSAKWRDWMDDLFPERRNCVSLLSATWRDDSTESGGPGGTQPSKSKSLVCKFRVQGEKAFNDNDFSSGHCAPCKQFCEGVISNCRSGDETRYDYGDYADKENWAILVKTDASVVGDKKNQKIGGIIKYPEIPPRKPQSDEQVEGGIVVKLVYKDVPADAVTCFFQYKNKRNGKEHQNDKPIYDTNSPWSLLKFRPSIQSDPNLKGNHVFALLDSVMSNGISRKELSPASGESLKAAGQSLVKFKVPLNQLEYLIPEDSKIEPGQRTEMKMQRVRVKVNRQFANREEWGILKRALNPEWKCEAPDQEEIRISMMPEYWEVWKNVITDCGMATSREWIRFYDGGYLDHMFLPGVHMRDGDGIQRWPDGSVYIGGWKNHAYDGEGTLWASVEDFMNVSGRNQSDEIPTPIFTGSHKNGNRNGSGTFNWQQDQYGHDEGKNGLYRAQTSGIKKCYFGNFKDGLFSGKGQMIIKGARSQVLPPAQNRQKGLLTKVPNPQIQPTNLLRYEGVYESDFNATFTEMHALDLDKAFIKRHGYEKKHLPPPKEKRGDFVLVTGSKPWKKRKETYKCEVETQILSPEGRAAQGRSEGKGKELSGYPETEVRRLEDKRGYSCIKWLRLADGSGYCKISEGEGIPGYSCFLEKVYLVKQKKEKDVQEGEDYEYEWKGNPNVEYENYPRFKPELSLDSVKPGEGTTREEHFMQLDKQGMQSSGFAIPDLATAYYSKKVYDVPNDCQHMKKGKGVYMDGTIYDGEYRNGYPHGWGKIEQFDESNTKIPVATYIGEWKGGKKWTTPGNREKSKYELKDNLIYKGDWKDNKRDGEGIQVVHKALHSVFGYSMYSGQWQGDTRTGEGKMIIPSVKDGSARDSYSEEDKVDDLIYEGQFVNGWREGFGTLKKRVADKKDGGEPEYFTIYSGKWKEDAIFTVKDAQGWSSLPGCYYYGSFTADGLRSGPGILYFKDAWTEKEFEEYLKTFKEHLTKESTPAKFVPSQNKDKFKLYEGNFEKGLPHDVSGKAQQYMWRKKKSKDLPSTVQQWMLENSEQIGMYKGHFKAGRRHGQGKFTSSTSEWTYDVISNEKHRSAHNWADDKLHGIAVVKSQKSEKLQTFENVIFSHNENQMGDNRKYGWTNDLEDLIKGAMNLKDILQSSVVLDAGLRRSNEEVRNPDLIQGEANITSEQLLLLRQPTDINENHNDVYVEVTPVGKGNAGRENKDEIATDKEANAKKPEANAKELGGLYIKLSESFGIDVYKNQQFLAKKVGSALGIGCMGGVGGTSTKTMTRYLFQDKEKKRWIISEKFDINIDSFEKLKNLGGTCAIAQNPAKNPADIPDEAWFVYHEDSKAFWLPGDPKFEQEAELEAKSWFHCTGTTWAARDKIAMKSVTGLMQKDCTFLPGLFLRQNSMLFGRPVYESENGGQYLYWLETVDDDGREEAMGEKQTQRRCKEMQEGMQPASLIAQDQVTIEDSKDQTRKAGYWIISKRVGAQPPYEDKPKLADYPDVLAYVKSCSYTPVRIHNETDEKTNKSVWMVGQNGSVFEELAKLEFEPHFATFDPAALDNPKKDDPSKPKQDTPKETTNVPP